MGDVSIVTNEHNLFTRCQLQIPAGFVADRPKITLLNFASSQMAFARLFLQSDGCDHTHKHRRLNNQQFFRLKCAILS